MKKIILTVLFSLLVSFRAAAQSFDATVNRTSLPEGETFVLTLDLQDVDTTASPDLSALSQDFTTFSISNGYRTNIINGQVSKSRQWNLVLMPNKSGSLTIPVIELAGYKTQPITLTVVPAGSADRLLQSEAENSPNFKITGSVDNKAPYVQQQLNYRLKIYDAGGLQGEAPFFATTNDDWIIKSLGEPRVSTQVVNGRSLREITFDYALFAQKSGELTIPPVRFNGYYLTKDTRTDPFARFFEDDRFFAGFGLNDVFASRNPVVLNTKPIQVSVRPAVSSSGWWLPAEEVKLSAEFEGGRPQFKVGEAVSRTIYLKAVGVLASQLPEIRFPDVEGIKQYPEKPQTDTTLENGKVVSYVKISNVYIPERSGTLTLPSVKVDWFNTATGSAETAVIPEYRAEVSAAVSVQNMPAAQPDASRLNPSAGEVVSTGENAPVTVIEQADNELIVWYLLAAFAGGILLTLLLTKFFARVASPSGSHKKMIIRAAKAKDLPQVRDELIAWAAGEFPRRRVANLQDVADIFQNASFNKELDRLRETLYAEDAGNWDDRSFIDIFCKIAKQTGTHKRTTDDPLPKLYK